jgi:predicted RecA/RadA family phage recombinase
MQNKIQDGKSLYFVNGGASAIAGGSMIVIGDIVGVPVTDINPGARGTVATVGVFRLPKVDDEAVDQGARVYVNPATGTLTTEVATVTGSGGDKVTTPHVPAGVAWAAAAETAVTVDVNINV